MENSITYAAMDTHKKDHKVALHYPGNEQIVRFIVKNTLCNIRKMVRKIKKQAPAAVEFCYEAACLESVEKNRVNGYRVFYLKMMLIP